MDALRNLCDAVYQRIGRVGATLLFERQKQVTGWAVFGLLLLLVGLEFYPGPAFLSEVQPRVVDRWLAGQAGPGAAAQFPVSQLTHPQQIYATLVHGKPIIGGFFSAHVPDQFRRVRPVLKSFPDQASVAMLKEIGVRWVVVDGSLCRNFQVTRVLIAAQGLQFRGAFGRYEMYEIP